MLKSIVLFLALLLGAYTFFVNVFPTHQGPSVINTAAPTFETTDLEKKPFSLAEQKGKVVIVNFWATWCAPCREEIPLLNQIYQEWKLNPKIELVAVVEDEFSNHEARVRAIEEFKKKVPFDFPVYIDADGSIADAFGTFQIPETFLIAPNGTITHKHSGPITRFDVEELKERVGSLINAE